MRKRIINSLVFASLAAFGLTAVPVYAHGSESSAHKEAVADKKAPATIPLAIEGMTCTGCEKPIMEALQKLDGVKSAAVSYKKDEALVTYDPAKVTKEQLIAAVKGAGYKAKTK